MHIIALVISALSLVLAAVHEIQWRRRRKWNVTTGTVVAETETDDYCFEPEIEYSFDGETRRFVSKYAGSELGVGTQVRVVFDPKSGDAELLNFTNRWLITIAILVFSFFWGWGGIAHWPA